MGKIIVPSLLVAFIISCTSIKENRRDCPCWYTVDFSNVNAQIPELYLWFFDGNGKLLCRDTLSAEEYASLYEIELKRGFVKFYAWGNVLENTRLDYVETENASLIKPDSLNADPLFGYGKILDTGGESGYDEVFMTKEHANLEIVIRGGAVVGDAAFEMILESATCGRYADGGFVEGKSCISSPIYEDAGNCIAKFRVLRQEFLADMKMSLKIVGEEDYAIEDFPIGEYLERGGYNMKEKNLKDARIELDVSAGEFVLDTENWRIVMPFEIEL